MDYIYLQGSEDVKRAASTIQSAAQTMQSASNNLSQSVYDHQQFLTGWLDRLESILKENK